MRAMSRIKPIISPHSRSLLSFSGSQRAFVASCCDDGTENLIPLAFRRLFFKGSQNVTLFVLESVLL
jgi:hypothetical protein